ncbi:amidase [Ideonella sp. B7]|uniref:amidase n=1 Tax=Ideonella benzenivorans TaxID=2831643 RepID=UPI001CECE4F3|nr:amidase [Ideonella benzenivorans]MCA6215964.1 amidase [Ideonella benzenivorans]
MSTDIVVLPLQLGPAEGPCFMVKDTLDVAGAPTRAGSRTLTEAAPATAHAEVVARLLAAGWRLTGKTNLHELAYGTTGINHWTGTPRNPRWPDRVPGGSSCGSAVAVAQGLVPMALGTDTGGSVRTPAACCGVFGLKPSFGRVSRRGVMPERSSLDCVGPIARDMDSLIAAMQAMVPNFHALPVVPPSLHIGLVDVACDAQARNAVHEALARARHRLHPVTLPLFEDAYRAGLAVINRENWIALSPLLADGRMGQDVATRLQRAGQTTDAQLAEAEAVRRAFRAEVDAALSQCDVLALPTLASPPPRLEDAADTSAAVSMTALVRPFNLSGHPAITLPLDNADGLPVGLQLVARHGADEWLCSVARSLSQQLDLHASLGEPA